MRTDVDGVDSALTQYRQLVGESDFLTWSTIMRSAEAWLRCERGDCEGAVEEIKEDTEWWKNNAGKLVVPWHLILQARAQDRAGRSDGALHSVDEAMGWVERYGERWQLAEIW